MNEALAVAIWLVMAAYAAIGAAVAIWLFAQALKRLDPLAAAAPLRVKLILAPGLVALWPLVLRRLSGLRAPEDAS